VPDSVAILSGLRPDDVILEYNGERIDTLAALTNKIRDDGEGSPVSLRIRRDGVEFYQGVQLGARAPAQR
jgi:S1-C subfamily serine protease